MDKYSLTILSSGSSTELSTQKKERKFPILKNERELRGDNIPEYTYMERMPDVGGEHQGGHDHGKMKVDHMLMHQQQDKHVCDMSLDMHHECDTSSNASHVTSGSSQHEKKSKPHGKKSMTFVDETLKVKKKISKKQDEGCFKRSKLRKSLSNQPFLENYFEYDNSNGTNQLKKFKLIESSDSTIVTSEIIQNLNAQSMHAITSAECNSSNTGSNSSTTKEEENHVESDLNHAVVDSNSNVLESPQNNINENVSNDNINLLLALLFVLTGDSTVPTQHVTI